MTENILKKLTMLTMTRCDGCGKLMTQSEYNVRHTGHEPGCTAVEDGTWCDCDLKYHADCCPLCHPELRKE